MKNENTSRYEKVRELTEEPMLGCMFRRNADEAVKAVSLMVESRYLFSVQVTDKMICEISDKMSRIKRDYNNSLISPDEAIKLLLQV